MVRAAASSIRNHLRPTVRFPWVAIWFLLTLWDFFCFITSEILRVVRFSNFSLLNISQFFRPKTFPRRSLSTQQPPFFFFNTGTYCLYCDLKTASSTVTNNCVGALQREKRRTKPKNCLYQASSSDYYFLVPHICYFYSISFSIGATGEWWNGVGMKGLEKQ